MPTPALFLQSASDVTAGGGLRSLASVLVVLALLVALAWAARRGGFGLPRGSRAMSVQTALSLGDRRSLVIVEVEGRRLLLGLTQTQVALVTELTATTPFAEQLDQKSEGA